MAVIDIDNLTGMDIMKSARTIRGVTQMVLAEKLGMKQSSVCGLLSRPRASLVGFAKVMDAMDYDVVVVDRRTGETMWTVGTEE